MYRASALFYGIFFNQIVNNIDILTDYLDENYDFITNGETYHYLTKKDFKIIIWSLYHSGYTLFSDTDWISRNGLFCNIDYFDGNFLYYIEECKNKKGFVNFIKYNIEKIIEYQDMGYVIEISNNYFLLK